MNRKKITHDDWGHAPMAPLWIRPLIVRFRALVGTFLRPVVCAKITDDVLSGRTLCVAVLYHRTRCFCALWHGGIWCSRKFSRTWSTRSNASPQCQWVVSWHDRQLLYWARRCGRAYLDLKLGVMGQTDKGRQSRRPEG